MKDICIDSSHIRWTQRADGDFSERRKTETGWSWLNQVHGGIVLVETKPGEHNGADADAIVSTNPDSVLSIATADCLAIAFVGDNGVIGAAHAGWRGLVAGVIENTAAKMRELGAREIKAASGPCIGPECYEFDPDRLNELANTFGPEIISETAWKTPALNLHKSKSVALSRAGVELVHEELTCTACNKDDYFSARARNEGERMAMIVWRDSLTG